ncbi:cytochrome P450 [Infundibulicybe gibba]|nr:cytochrome P450 [Infundibulicybe gibba]
MSLRPPSTSPSPSPGPHDAPTRGSRQSMGPSARGTPGLAPASPRPGMGGAGARPTSELLGGAGMFQTPEAEALDLWFENLQNYETTLEDMAAASLDVNFKEELSAIEQWFKVLSEAERTAALYSLLQHSTQVQIRFFITVLQQMARSDPMTALLSPAMGGSMQSQMEAKLASLPASPTTRSFAPGARQSLALDPATVASATAGNAFLSPDSAAGPAQDAAATLAQQRAKLKAVTQRIASPLPSLPALVSEQQQQQQQQDAGANRPKSTEFSGTLGSPRPEATNNANNTVTAGDSWASMVNTPLMPMFGGKERGVPQSLDAASNKLNDWTKTPPPAVPRMGDPTVHRRNAKASAGHDNGNMETMEGMAQRGGMRSASGALGGGGGGGGNWGGRSPGLPGGRFGEHDGLVSNQNQNQQNQNPNGMQLPSAGLGGFGMPLGSPGLGLGMPNGGLGGMPLNFNMLSAMGISPEAQLLAAQMAASGFGQGAWMGMPQGPHSAAAGMGGGNMGMNNRRGPASGRPNPPKSASSAGRGPDSAGTKGEEEVDPALLADVPAWLRSLRLHKYTPNFEGMKWQDMVMMDEAALEANGVAALGARRKMLKTFELVRKKMGMEAPGALAGYVCKRYLQSVWSRSRFPLPPGPKPKSLVGNMFDIPVKSAWLTYTKWGETYGSDILHAEALGQHIIVLNSLEDAVEILERRASNYSDRPGFPMLELAGLVDFNAVLLPHSELWQRHRRVFQQSFRQDAIAAYEPIEMKKIHQLLKGLLESPGDLRMHVRTVAAAIILRVVYGYDVLPKNDHLMLIVEKAVEHGAQTVLPGAALVNTIPALKYIPPWFPGAGFHQRAAEVKQLAYQMQNTTFDFVRKNMEAGTGESSLLGDLLEANDARGGSAEYETILKGVSATAYAAGAETTVSSVMTFFYAMATNPEVQWKAQAEIDAVIGPERLPEPSDRSSLPYVEALYREVMRWRPVLPLGLPHTSTEDDIYKGFFIPKGSLVFANIWAMTQNADTYKNPDVFHPERYLDDQGRLNDDDTVLAFGFGRRVCVGRHFARATVWLIIASVLAAMNITKAKDAEGNDIEIEGKYTDGATRCVSEAHSMPHHE